MTKRLQNINVMRASDLKTFRTFAAKLRHNMHDVLKLYYWTSPGTAEVEFVIQWDDEIIPVEVKAEENISGNSLSVYFKTYSPRYRMRFSMLNLQYNSGLLSSPAPLAGWLDKWMTLIFTSPGL